MNVLVVVDMQNDFIDGALAADGGTDIVDKVIKRIKESKGELVLFTRDTHSNDYLDTPEGKKLPVVHCIKDTHGWQIQKDIFSAWRNNSDTISLEDVKNNTFDKPVFGSVDLVSFLKSQENKITQIELLGICTDICVISNAIMIKNTLPNTTIIVNSNCCAGVTKESHIKALDVMKMCQIDIL